MSWHDERMTGAVTDRTVFRTCPLCEATCGLEITIRDGNVARIRGDRDDVFSSGFICPKGSSLKHLHEDPDRLRKPVVRRGVDADGAPVFVEVEWDEAWQVVDEKLSAVRTAHGTESVGIYLGNPAAHLLSASTHLRQMIKAVGSHNRFSASTVDQMPRHVASGHLYGGGVIIPIPDIERTDLLVMFGANPFESNGSICTAPGFPDRIDAMRERGVRVVVIDPRRTKTAEHSDQHIAVKPGTDAVLLAAMISHLFASGLVDAGDVAGIVDGLDELPGLLEAFTPDAAAPITGVGADTIRGLAEEIANSESAAIYGRIGTCTVEFGTLTTWLLDVLSIVTGNLDRVGGSMFPSPATERVRAPREGREYKIGRFESRVHGRPEVQGEFPVADLPDEILTSGKGQLRMMVTFAGNPVLSCPDGARMDEAFADLEAMISFDIYINETTRHADVILPPPGSLEKSHYDISFYGFGVHNIANYSPAVFEGDGPSEDDILAKFTMIASGMGTDVDPSAVHDQMVRGLLESEVRSDASPVAGRDVDELIGMVYGHTGSDRVLDATLRTGPYGDGFGADPDGLSITKLLDNPHGVDLGPLVPRLPGILRSPTGRINLWAGPFAAELERLLVRQQEWAADDRLKLVSRRHLRSNNSWMHNLEVLVKGRPRCTLQIHPDDARRLGLAEGGEAEIKSKVGKVVAPVEITDLVMAGVVSLPHGWGHSLPGTRMEVARRYSGVNSNLLTDPEIIDPMSGNAVLNAIPVEVSAV